MEARSTAREETPRFIRRDGALGRLRTIHSARCGHLGRPQHSANDHGRPTGDQDDGTVNAALAKVNLSALWDHATVSGRALPLWWAIPRQSTHVCCRCDRFPALGFVRGLTGDQTGGQNGEERPL